MPKKLAIGIMFRLPEFGMVKKRLAAQIGKNEALNVYASMLYVTINRISTLKDIDIYGFYNSLNRQSVNLNNIKTLPQQGENLGEKMLNAFEYLFKNGYDKVLLIGADSPDLPVDYITEAFSMLDSFDMVIGPTEDGGFYLIGSNKPLPKTMFDSIQWGSSKVLMDTVRNAKNLSINYFLLNSWYDIDDQDSLNRWKSKIT